MLTTLATVKARLALATADTTHDAVLTTLLSNVSSAFAAAAGRVVNGVACLEYGAVVEHLSPKRCQETLWLTARPVIAITELKEALYDGWSGATALTESTDYQLYRPWGQLTRIGGWLTGHQTVRATYTGGYTVATEWVSGATYTVGDLVTRLGIVYVNILGTSGTTAPAADSTHWTAVAGAVPLPLDVAELAIQQIVWEFGNRTDVGRTSGAVQGASFSKAAPGGLLPYVRERLELMRRRM